MINYLRNYFSNLVFTLRFSLLSIFIVLFTITLLIIGSVFYFYMTSLVSRAALLLMDTTARVVLHEIDLKLHPIMVASQWSAKNIHEEVVDVGSKEETTHYLINLLDRLPLAQAAYWADTKGNVVYAQKEKNGQFLTEIINPYASSFKSLVIYRDKEFREIKRENILKPSNYKSRPWFAMAFGKKETIWTPVYAYPSDPPFLGISVATPVYDDDGKPYGIFGIDVRLDQLESFIEHQKVGEKGEVLILDRSARVVVAQHKGYFSVLRKQASPMEPVQHSMATSWVKEAFTVFQREAKPTFQFDQGGVSYLATFKSIPILSDQGWLIAVIDRTDDFTGEIYIIGWIYFLTAFVVFVMGILLISHLVTKIVVPIKKLVKETKQIKNFHLEGDGRVVSHIKEVLDISDAIYAMKKGLRSFQKYVPSTLVRQLIRTGEDVHIGGAKRELAVFFSDIKDFTSITEKVDSNELMKQLCEYLDAFSHIIIEKDGTVDKYIGDAIMAFWGAPIQVDNICHHAALVAFACMKRLAVLNANWSKENKPLFLTRIGIHFGEAIVGNLGSSERLNYTALGDTVNIASRLVDVNKIYGTSILVTDPVYQRIKNNMVLRLVDHVTLKGKEKVTAIYELVAEKQEDLPYDIAAYQRVFHNGFSAYQQGRFDEALLYFNQCLEVYPDDTVAITYIKRCQQFKAYPKPDWNGVWHFSEK